MADTAAHLVDRVFPEVPFRQWVLPLPFALRYRLAYDAHLVRDVLHIFVQTVFGSLRRRAGFLDGLGLPSRPPPIARALRERELHELDLS
jgi:hypothetical protein